MLLALGVTGLALLALPALTRPAGRRLHPAEWTRLCLIGVTAGLLIVEAAAVLYAAPTLAGASGIPGLAHLCRRALGPLAPGGAAAGWTATAIAVTLPFLGAVGWTRARREVARMRVEPWLGRHQELGAHELVVLPMAEIVAVSVPAPRGCSARGQIVVSDGLVDALADIELDAVLHHEAAHLSRRHHRHLVVATMVDHAFAWFPPARRSTAAWRLALERWADEDAAASIDRGVLRRALLAVTASLVAERAIAAFSAVDTICERLDALDRDVPHARAASHVLLYLPGAALAGAAMVAFASWTNGASAVLAMAGQCA